MPRVWTLLLLLLVASLGWAQSQSGTYRIQEDDRLSIQVFDEQQIQGIVVVTPDGNISAPFAGIVRAIGKTTSELEAELSDIYVKKLRLREPRVSVTVVGVRRILATITGVVIKPGQYEMRPGQTVADLVAQGAITDASDLRRATFKRKGWNESIPLDLYALVQNGNLTQNYVVEDGDLLNVPQKKNYYIRIWGEVGAPRNVPFEEGMDLVSAIATAGGPNPTRAKQSKVLVYRRKPGTQRQYFIIRCNLVAYQRGDMAQNILLQPGDTVYVTNNGNPNFELLNSLANTVFILDRFGLDIFGSRN